MPIHSCEYLPEIFRLLLAILKQIFFSFRYSDFCQSPKLPENPTLRPWLHETGTLVKYPATIQTISLSPSKLSICSKQGEQRENAQERAALA